MVACLLRMVNSTSSFFITFFFLLSLSKIRIKIAILLRNICSNNLVFKLTLNGLDTVNGFILKFHMLNLTTSLVF